MIDRYRELEGLKSARKLDVVLMATVSSFSALENPGRGELQRFTELFPPVYEASNIEARRQAVAALSSQVYMPQEICRYIGCQEIAIAAPFLARSPAINDTTLISIIETMGEEHVRAIIHRSDLSQKVVQALIGTHKPQEEIEPSENSNLENGIRDDTEALRQTLKAMASKAVDNNDDRFGLATISALQTALLVRFSRRKEMSLFLETFARVLGGDRILASAIMGDASGHKLAISLVALGMNTDDTGYILPRLLTNTAFKNTNDEAKIMITALKPNECIKALLQWQNERAQEEAISKENQQNRATRDNRRSA